VYILITMLNNCKTELFCLCLFLVCKSSIASWDFWPFNINTMKTPTVKIIPEVEGNLIHYKENDEMGRKRYVDSTTKFLSSYERYDQMDFVRNCDFHYPPPENSVCAFDIKQLGPCAREDFGFSRATPCIYFTLSQVLNWIPTTLNGSDIQQHSDPFLNVPNDLRTTIESTKPFEKYIWFSCDGETAPDREFIGSVSYFPRQGFPAYYFPFKDIGGYRSPIVALRFERPMRGVAISIECRAWATNIELNRDSGVGYVKFYLMID